MRKLLLLLVLLSGLTLTAQNKPDALYLCGDMNNWITPIDGGTRYALTDADGDGFYEGTFEIPDNNNGYLSFKIFRNIAGWADTEDYYGCYSSPASLFKDNRVVVYVENFASNNISIDNWTGGTLKVVFNYNDRSVELSSDTQPDIPAAPDVYVVGSFNDWQIPDANSANGAIQLPLISIDDCYSYLSTPEFPKGELGFKFYVKDPETGEVTYWGTPALPAMTLYKVDGVSNPLFTTLTKYNASPVEIANWEGGRMPIGLYMNFNKFSASTEISGLDQPEFPFDDSIYAIYDTGDGEREILTLPITKENGYCNYAWAKGSNPSIIFTTEYSLNPAPENCWGIAENLNPELNENGYFYFSLVKGGKAISKSFRDLGQLNVGANWMSGILTVNFINIIKPVCPDEIYLIGSPQGWRIDDGSMPLPRIEEYADGTSVYSEVFEISESEPILRFYSQLGDWENNSIGSQYDDTPINIEVTDETSYYDAVWPGKGSWRITNWESGKLRITVTLREYGSVVEFARYNEEGVSEVEENDADAIYFNLQGVKLDSPIPGVVIKVVNGKSSKIIVR